MQVACAQERPDGAEQTRRWRPPTTGHSARRSHPTQHVGIVIETIVIVMAFDLANAVLTVEKRLHAAIPHPANESLGRDPKTEVQLLAH